MTVDGARLEIVIAPLLSDNYAYLLRDTASGETAVVDPAQAAPIKSALDSRGWDLSVILITHHHSDHTGGVAELASHYGAAVLGPAGEADSLPALTRGVKQGEEARLGKSAARVLPTPGHTAGHIAYWFEDEAALFCGDALFSLGCGRLFEGTPSQMWDSMLTLRALPEQTRIYCGHEYSEANLRFALSVDGDNAALAKRGGEIKRQRAAGQPTIPALMASERLANPFLRADDAALAESLGMAGAPPAEVFAALRRGKDSFAG